MNRKKGHNYITVFSDLVNKRVPFGTAGKDASVWERFAQELRAHNGHPGSVKQVAVDMSPAFIKGMRDNFGNGDLMFEKSQVTQEVNKAWKHTSLRNPTGRAQGQPIGQAPIDFPRDPEPHTLRGT